MKLTSVSASFDWQENVTFQQSLFSTFKRTTDLYVTVKLNHTVCVVGKCGSASRQPKDILPLVAVTLTLGAAMALFCKRASFNFPT